MATSLASELDADLADAIASFEQTFTWNGRNVSCTINFAQSKLITAKSYFGAAGARVYPRCGEMIVVGGHKAQIIKKGDAEIKAATGGFVEDPPFIDDASDPSLHIEFANLIRK